MQVIAPHRVTNLNIVDPGVDELFNDGRKADIFFSDPPWGDGAIKMFTAMARKNGGQEFSSIAYEDMLSRIADLIQEHVTGHVFLETGLRWEDSNQRMMESIGLTGINRVELLYKSGGKMLPSVLLSGGFNGSSVALSDLHHASGAGVAVECIRRVTRPGGIVFDPCCGMGYSSAAALANGMEFRGNELNPARLAKTVKRLSA